MRHQNRIAGIAQRLGQPRILAIGGRKVHQHVDGDDFRPQGFQVGDDGADIGPAKGKAFIGLEERLIHIDQDHVGRNRQGLGVAISQTELVAEGQSLILQQGEPLEMLGRNGNKKKENGKKNVIAF